MVANFAMSVLNGVGGAKLEKIFSFTKGSFTESNFISIHLDNVYKYVIFELVYFGNIDSSTKIYLNCGPQIFFIDDNSNNKQFIITYPENVPSNIQIGLQLNAYIDVSNNFTVKHTYSGNWNLQGTVYCFN